MISISHWGMFHVEPYDQDVDLRHRGLKYAYLELIHTPSIGLEYR